MIPGILLDDDIHGYKIAYKIILVAESRLQELGVDEVVGSAYIHIIPALTVESRPSPAVPLADPGPAVVRGHFLNPDPASAFTSDHWKMTPTDIALTGRRTAQNPHR